jgi:LDH2 family malate/lactate/ureidoglycolate dehydrogenase
MSNTRKQFEAYLRAQVEGCTTDAARAMGVAYREQLRAALERLHSEGLGPMTIRDAVAVLALGEYMKPADPDERARQGLEWLERVRGGKGDE